jgi:hypothetical protein
MNWKHVKAITLLNLYSFIAGSAADGPVVLMTVVKNSRKKMSSPS